jgi:tetratricopeptide (TPR) repeat protein
MGKRTTGSAGRGMLLGRYRLEKEIGAGMMGTVYRGVDTLIGRQVAIKAIRVAGASGANARTLRERLLVEARAAGRIHHPNVVTLYDVAQEGDDLFLIFEFVKGKPLSTLLERGPLDPETARRIALDAARGLAAAHALGIVHRDVKPSNLLLAKDGTVKVADFGVARLEGSRLTQTGQTVGTPAYMSPEQAQGKRLDGRSDVFSLGVVLYEMLTGTNPFAAENAPAAMLKVAYEEPPPLATLAPDVPPEFETAVRRALAKDPRTRPDAIAFADELERLAPARTDAAARAAESRAATAKRAARVGARAAALAALALALALVAEVGRDPYREARRAIREGRHDAALAALGRAGRGDPERHRLAALAALGAGRIDRARAALDSLYALDPDARRRLLLDAWIDTAAWARRTDHARAAEELEAIARVLPPDPALALLRARHLWRAGALDAAATLLARAGADDPWVRLYALDLAHEDCTVRRAAALWFARHPESAPVDALRQAHARTVEIRSVRPGWWGRLLPGRDTAYTCDRAAVEAALRAAGAEPAAR